MSRPFIPAPNCASVEFLYTCQNVNVENQIHVVSNAPFSDANLATLVTTCDSWHNVTAKPLQASSTALVGLRAKALDTPTSPFYVYYLATPRTGSSAAGAAAPGLTFAVKLQSNLSSRSTRGRLFWVGMTTFGISAGVMTSAQAANHANAVTTLINNIHAANANWNMCILSYRVNKAWRAEALPTPITSVSYTDLNVDVQRRRMPGH